MTQFNQTLTTTAPRKTTEPLLVRLMRYFAAIRTRCALPGLLFDASASEADEEWDRRAW